MVFGLLATLATAAESQPAASQLGLHARLNFVADPVVPCPPGSPDSLICPVGTGEGAVPGLGTVESTSKELHQSGPPCSTGYFKFLGHPESWVVANKGEIDFVIAASECVGSGISTDAFTVTGGAGLYAGASGSGTVTHTASLSSDGKVHGYETWTGALTVPGLDFDTTAPVLTGAANKTVKAKKGARSARVTFKVTAQDDKDGAVPATCVPQSGSRFRVGRTVVECSVTDSSANAASASFKITVRR